MKVIKKPWGDFKEFILNKKCTVKIITVKPGQELSLQKHTRRKEMWYFLTPGKVIVGNKNKKMKKGETIIIKKKVPHRLIARWKKVIVLEIAVGHFDENDIVRLEDKYGRIKDQR